MKLHPDDLLFFNEVVDKMRRVAKDYDLPLKTVAPLSMPKTGMADRMGDCAPWTGHINIVFRCTVDGQWCEHPLSPEEVWDTAAHELAHFRYAHHNEAFQTFRLEMLVALRNAGKDHREKVIDKLIKIQAQAASEKAIGNAEAAEAFAAMLNKMLISNELSVTDLEYAKARDNDPIVEVTVDRLAHGIEQKKTRVAWQEHLARIVAKGHMCTFLIRVHSNSIVFVGTRSHAMVAEYAYGTLVPAAEKMSLRARHVYREELRQVHGIESGKSLRGVKEGFGFREAWLDGFVRRIGERLDEARATAVQEASAQSGSSTSTALIRLDGALAKARKYTDDKFSGRSGVSALNSRGTNHREGQARGKAAADAMTLGRKALTQTASGRNRLLDK
jgi:hypothetical protein